MDDHPPSVSSGRSRAGRRTSGSCTRARTRADIVALLSLSDCEDAIAIHEQAPRTGAGTPIAVGALAP